MPTSRSLAIVIAGASLGAILCAELHAADDQSQTDVVRAQKSGEILGQDEIVRRAQSDFPGKVVEIELERKRGRYVYEVEVVDEQGGKKKFKYDAKTGEPFSTEVEHDDEADAKEGDHND